MGFQVVMANFNKQHSFQTALAAQEAGALRKFVTSLYYKPKHLPYSLIRNGKGAIMKDEVARLRGRRLEGLPDESVVSVLLPEFIELAGTCAPGLKRLVDPRTLRYLRCELFDRVVARRHVTSCSIFHGFEQCALFSLQRAKELGAVTVLEQPFMERGVVDRLDAEQRRRLGIPKRRNHHLFQAHVERKYKELEFADYLFVGLDFVKRTFVEAGFPEDRIYLIPYGANTRVFQPVDRRGRDTFNILFVGQLCWYKGLHYVLEAFADLRIPNARLTILASGVDPEWEDCYRRLISTVGDQCTYVSSVPNTEMMSYYAEADVLVFPSLVGGIGMTVFEAMATGLPVVVSDGDVVIKNGVDGFVVNARDVEGLRQMLARLHEDSALRLRVGMNGVQTARRFTWEHYRAGVIRAYEDIRRRSHMQ